MIIADIPENLPVPTISTPSSSIPPWNARHTGYVETIFEFASDFLQNDGALLLFLCDDRHLISDIFEQAHTYDFVLHKDWWGINDLGLASPKDSNSTVIKTILNPMMTLCTPVMDLVVFVSHVLVDCSLFDSGFTSSFEVAT